MSTIPELTKTAKDLMAKAIENTRKELSGIRSSKASTTLLDVVRVEAYGNMVPLSQFEGLLRELMANRGE